MKTDIGEVSAVLRLPKPDRTAGKWSLSSFPPDSVDVRAVPDSPDLMLPTDACVWCFHREDAAFRPDPDLKDRVEVKSSDNHPATGRHVVAHASGANWWTEPIARPHPCTIT